MNTTVTVKKVADFPIIEAGKKYLATGWVLVRADGKMFSSDGVYPYVFGMMRGAKAAASDGIIPGATFV